jgi:hypothetical protein
MSEAELREAAEKGKRRDAKTLASVYWYLAMRPANSRKRDG